jgi:uncharacterized protein
LFLIDSNCWMQILRARPFANEVRAFLQAIPSSRLFVTDFSINSIALNLEYRKQLHDFPAFLEWSTIGTEIAIIRLYADELRDVVRATSQHGLDYDDAYQYVAADLDGLRLVSINKHFDRTPNGRLTPAAALNLFKEEPNR